MSSDSVMAVDWRQSAAEIVAALEQCGTLKAQIFGQTVIVRQASAGGLRSAYAPGTIIRCDDRVWVQAGAGHVVLERISDSQGELLDAAAAFVAQGIHVGQCFTLPHDWSRQWERAA